MKTLLHFLMASTISAVTVLGSEKSVSVVAQVSVRTNGDMLVDGVKSDLRELHLILASREQRSGDVWLFRAASGEASRVATKVVEVVRSYALTIQPLKEDPQKNSSASAPYRKR